MTCSIPSCVTFTKHIYVHETNHYIQDLFTTRLHQNNKGYFVEGDLQYYKPIRNHTLELKKITMKSDFKDVSVGYYYDLEENVTYILF